jgi:hypothetical protein
MKLKFVLVINIIIPVIFYPNNSFAEIDKWVQKANMPTERGYLATSEVDGKKQQLYVNVISGEFLFNDN